MADSAWKQVLHNHVIFQHVNKALLVYLYHIKGIFLVYIKARTTQSVYTCMFLSVCSLKQIPTKHMIFMGLYRYFALFFFFLAWLSHQNNFSVATKLLKELHREAKADKGRLQRWVHSYSRFNQRKSQGLGPTEQIISLLKIVPQLGDNCLILNQSFKCYFYRLKMCLSINSERQSQVLNLIWVFCCVEEFEKDSEGFTGKVFRDQRILLGTTFDLLACAVRRSPSTLQTIGEEKAQRILQLSRASFSHQVAFGVMLSWNYSKC